MGVLKSDLPTEEPSPSITITLPLFFCHSLASRLTFSAQLVIPEGRIKIKVKSCNDIFDSNLFAGNKLGGFLNIGTGSGFFKICSTANSNLLACSAGERTASAFS